MAFRSKEISMEKGRLRAALAAASVLSLLAAGGAFVVVDRRQDREAAEERAEARRATAAAGEERRASAREEGEEEGEGPAGLLDSLLGALGGEGGDAGVPGLSASVLTSCGQALTDALPESGPKLLPDRQESSRPAAEQVRRIAAAVADLRGLEFTKVPEPVFLSPDDFTRRVQDQVTKELDAGQLAAEGRVLVALGALPAGSDLAALTRQALGSQVAGFYDPDTGDLVVRRSGASGDASLDSQTRIILAHELDHALTDQALGLPEEDRRPGSEDSSLARLALVEGDATLVMQLYGLAHVALLEQLSGLSGAAASAEELAKLPHHLQRNLTAPYFDGMAFACAQYAAGGWAALDKVYDDLPTTSAQVLFPDRYRAKEAAVDPRDPPAPGGSWRATPARALGASELQWLLEAPGGDAGKGLDGAGRRGAAWAGGEVHQWTDGARTATAVGLVQRAGESPLCATVVAWYSAAFAGGRPVAKAAGEELALDGERQDAVVRCAGADVRLGIAPDLATARAIAG